MMNLEEMGRELEGLMMTTAGRPQHAYNLFSKVCDELEFTYFNPGEPEAQCNFCGHNYALPGCYGEEVMMDDEEIISSDVYWTRVWAERAMDLLDPQYAWEPCCADRELLMEALDD